MSLSFFHKRNSFLPRQKLMMFPPSFCPMSIVNPIFFICNVTKWSPLFFFLSCILLSQYLFFHLFNSIVQRISFFRAANLPAVLQTGLAGGTAFDRIAPALSLHADMKRLYKGLATTDIKNIYSPSSEKSFLSHQVSDPFLWIFLIFQSNITGLAFRLAGGSY